MDIPRSVENKLRAVMKKVHAARLAESLAPVEEAIRKWRDGTGEIFVIDDVIHQHQMRSKRYWHLYANTRVTSPEMGYILDEALELKIVSPKDHEELKALWNRPKRKV